MPGGSYNSVSHSVTPDPNGARILFLTEKIMDRSKQTGPMKPRDPKSAQKPNTDKLHGKDGSGQGGVPIEVANKTPPKKK